MKNTAHKKRISGHRWRKSLSDSFKERLMMEMERVVCHAQKNANGAPVGVDATLDKFVAESRIDRKLAAGILWSLVGLDRLEFRNDFRTLATTPKTRYCPAITADRLARMPRHKPKP